MKTRKHKIPAYWIRNGRESFLLSNVYMNKENAELVCKGRNLPAQDNIKKEHKVITIEIIYKV